MPTHLVHQDLAQDLQLLELGARRGIDDRADGIRDARLWGLATRCQLNK